MLVPVDKQYDLSGGWKEEQEEEDTWIYSMSSKGWKMKQRRRKENVLFARHTAICEHGADGCFAVHSRFVYNCRS